jgi:hypothetical protein
LADGQVLTAGGYRCFVTGFAVTCSAPATGLGFTVSQVAYLLYPRDGTAPEPGQPVLQSNADAGGADVIGPDGYENFRLRMTVSQAQQADPTLVFGTASRCIQASTKDAKRVMFNPDGTLAYIEPRGSPHTPEGLRVGDTADKAFTLYAPDGGSRKVSINYSGNRFPVAVEVRSSTSSRFRFPMNTMSKSMLLTLPSPRSTWTVANGASRSAVRPALDSHTTGTAFCSSRSRSCQEAPGGVGGADCLLSPRQRQPTQRRFCVLSANIWRR